MMGLTPTISQILAQLKAALAALTNKSFHYVAAPNTIPPYIVWAEDDDNDLTADDSHAERAIQGAVDLYTKTEEDPLRDAIPEVLEGVGAAYYFNSFQYETETGLLHFEWVFEVI